MDEIFFGLEIDPDDVGKDWEYSGYRIEQLDVDHEKKKVRNIHYSYIWDCGDGCCSERVHTTYPAENLPEWVKNRILSKFPGYSFGL